MTQVFSCPYDVFFGVHQIHEQGKIPKYEKVMSKLLDTFYILDQVDNICSCNNRDRCNVLNEMTVYISRDLHNILEKEL